MYASEEIIYYEEDHANNIVDNYGECWMNNDETIVYIAVIKDDKIRDKRCFYLEMGVNRTDGFSTNSVSIEDLPASCVLNKPKQEDLPASAMDFYQSDNYSICKLVLKPALDVEPQGIADHKIRPMVAGCGINNTRAENGPGTLGAFLTLKDQGSSVFLISNFHVLNGSKEANYDDIICQPHNIPRDYRNAIAKYISGKYGFDEKTGATLDFGLAKLMGHEIAMGRVYRRDFLFTRGFVWSKETIEKFGPVIKDKDTPYYNQEVFMCGKTTGISKTKKVRSLNAMVRIKDAYLNSQKRIFKRQLLLKQISLSGDSGSLLIDADTNKAIGLIHSGDNTHISIANNIDHIFDQIHDFNREERRIQLNKFLT